MRILPAAAALLLLAGAGRGKPPTRTVTNPSSLRAEAHFWSRPLAEVERGQEAQVLKEEGPWLRVKLSAGEGYLPSSAFTSRAAEGPVRGLSREATSGLVAKSGLAAADGWVGKFEGEKGAGGLQRKLEAEMPGFLKDGFLGGGP